MKKKTKETEVVKIKLVIDTDISNDVDDQFAIAYALSRSDFFDLQAITIAPYKVDWQQNVGIRDGMIDSKNEADRILRLFGIKYNANEPVVYLGCEGFLSDNISGRNPAVEKIIKLAKKSDNLVICCLGTLTNVAMALRLAPNIASKLKIVWFGTDCLALDKFEDSNYKNDVVAFNEVLCSKAHFVIYPAFLGRNFVTSTYELENNTQENNVTHYLRNLLYRSSAKLNELSMKTIYDIGPIAYLLNEKEFVVKQMPATDFVKGKKIAVPVDRQVDYICQNPKNFFVWKDFLRAVNSNKYFYYSSKVYFVSDTHFNHESKVKRHLVPFETVGEMNNELVRRWNAKVGPDDLVYHLGDFGDYEFVKKLNGKIVLICGNYEEDDYRRDFDAFRQKLLKMGFADVVKDGVYLDENVLGQRVYLTHKPTNHAKDCKTLFGHVHSLALVKDFGFNVCVTYHYFAPISQITAKRYLKFVCTTLDEDATL